MSNMQDIADKAGVSRATVSRVLSDHPSVKAATRKKVLHWVKELGYEPNLIAQSLAGNSTNIIGVIVPEIAYPFFSEKRLLLLDGTGILKTGKDEFVSIMGNMPETTCIIICEPEVDKRSKVYKWIKKNGYVGEFLKKNQTEKVLLRWIAALLGKEKKQIRENNARYFLQKTGDDMFQIKNEIDKLIAYAGDREEITQADIDAVASGEVQDKIFDLVDAIARKNKAAALSYYNDLILLKEPPMHILFLIVRQYRILHIIANMRGLRKPDDAIAKTAGIPRFAIRKNEQQLRGYGEKMLEKCIEECIQIEEEIKTGRINDQIGVESLICRLML